jgi:hypothetical protein
MTLTGVDRGCPVRRPGAVSTTVFPLGTPSWIRLFRNAFKAFLLAVSEYVFATDPPQLRAADPA